MNRSFAVRCVILFALVFFVILTPVRAELTADAGPYRLHVVTDPPVVPAQGKVKMLIRVTDSSGKRVSGVTVRAMTKMPGMDMGEREGTGVATGSETGMYAVPATFAMEGGYESTVVLSGPLGNATARLSLHTGQNTAASGKSGFPWRWVIVASVVACVAVFVLWRMRRAGTMPTLAAVVNRQTLGAALLLAVVAGVAVYAVNNLRRPGALTPVDAQAMDMSYMPPPPGFAPVELATVSRGGVESSVRYTATAAGFTEQPVYSRVTGTLLAMPFYAGDPVKKGQLLARMDTSQTQPQQAERQAAVSQATQGVGVARADQEQAEAEITQAHAELSGKRGAVTEAKNNVRVATEAKASAEAAREAARAQVADAEAQITGAQADAAFWKIQLERSAALLKAGAISGEEFQRDRAQAGQAEAKLHQAKAQTARMKAESQAQDAAVRQATAQIAASEAKVQMAQSELSAHFAHVRVTEAARNSARQKVGQAQSGVAQARAMLAAATANQGYAEIRAPFDGVVVARQIAPGTLVSPGQAILTVAQIDPIRVQASVEGGDFAKARVGSPVRIIGRDGSAGQKPIPARVTSIVPAVDATSRTGVVEAVIPNPGRRILPGQFLAMELSTGSRRGALRVPSRALIHRPVSGEVASDATTPTVWVAEAAGEAGQFAVRPVAVRVGIQGGDVTEILSGLSEGERVVVAGGTYLKEGDTVAETAAPPGEPELMAKGETVSPSSEVMVTVTEKGFEPSALSLKVGVPARITFTRETDATCATEVLFPDYGINNPLPLNTPVVVSFTPKKGTFTFACGMNMIKGKVVAQ
ncbi:MAG: efflux RND transporter periplasmic adaptor subunit [Fibrella sp.]|nr:efflux RND transporter periplasmic adaptor subunit [Armatimonadota bacterium]